MNHYGYPCIAMEDMKRGDILIVTSEMINKVEHLVAYKRKKRLKHIKYRYSYIAHDDTAKGSVVYAMCDGRYKYAHML